MAKFLVETYAPASEALDAAVERARAASHALGDEGIEVHHLKAIHVPGDETTFHVFEGPSIKAVGEVSARAGLSLARIVEMFEAGSDPLDTMAASAPLDAAVSADVTELDFDEYGTTAEGA